MAGRQNPERQKPRQAYIIIWQPVQAEKTAEIQAEPWQEQICIYSRQAAGRQTYRQNQNETICL